MKLHLQILKKQILTILIIYLIGLWITFNPLWLLDRFIDLVEFDGGRAGILLLSALHYFVWWAIIDNINGRTS